VHDSIKGGRGPDNEPLLNTSGPKLPLANAFGRESPATSDGGLNGDAKRGPVFKSTPRNQQAIDL
jgi:hypothetical protein